MFSTDDKTHKNNIKTTTQNIVPIYLMYEKIPEKQRSHGSLQNSKNHTPESKQN